MTINIGLLFICKVFFHLSLFFHNFKWLSIKRLKYSIHNCTLKNYDWSKMNYMWMFKSYFRSWNFSPIVTYFWKTYYDLNVILLNLEKKNNIFQIFYRINDSRVPLWIGLCHHCMKGHMKYNILKTYLLLRKYWNFFHHHLHHWAMEELKFSELNFK